MKKIIVVGAGAAGLLAAIFASEEGAKVFVIEKMKEPLKKLKITGKGRCNLTNTLAKEEFIHQFSKTGKFLYSAFNIFFNKDLEDFFKKLGVPIKIERGGRIFPQSDKATDIADALVFRAKELGVIFHFETKVTSLLITDGCIKGIKTVNGQIFLADAVILATGGKSYPLTGSTGDGYSMVKRAGHHIVRLLPSLVPLETHETWVKEVQGLTLKNVCAELHISEKKVASLFGDMLFTHFGVTGPVILSLSRMASEALTDGKKVSITINLKPALTNRELKNRVERDFSLYINKNIHTTLLHLLPKSLITPFLSLLKLRKDKKVNQLTKQEREEIIFLLQNLKLNIKKTRPLKEAIVTAGGIDTKEINPKTMESKIVQNLYFAGELVDVDAKTGGFNLQAAFSMGVVAGKASASKILCKRVE